MTSEACFLQVTAETKAPTQKRNRWHQRWAEPNFPAEPQPKPSDVYTPERSMLNPSLPRPKGRCARNKTPDNSLTSEGCRSSHWCRTRSSHCEGVVYI